MTTESPHIAFSEAYAYVLKYFEQVAKLLVDANLAMERDGFTMLRPNGEALVGGPNAHVGRANTWLANWLFMFYAPTDAFGGRKYGVASVSVSAIPFIGVGMHGTETGGPAAYVGWLAPTESTEDVVEKSIRRYFDSIDSTHLNPTPKPVTSTSEISWTPVPHCYQPLHVALVIVPLDLITGPRVIDELVANLGVAVRAASG